MPGAMKNLFLIGSLLLLLLQGCINDANESASGTYKSKQPIIYIDKGDKQFAVDAALKGLANIELGKLAIKKGSDKKIKNFGTLLIKQHTKIGKRLRKITDEKKIPLPTEIDSATKKDLVMLSEYSGKAFDKVFLNFMINNHETDIKFFEYASKHVVDKDLKKQASKTLLILHRHQYALNGIKAILKY
jgi:putative membrane protein